MSARTDRRRAAMRATVHARLRSGLDPGPPRRAAFVAVPRRPLKNARDAFAAVTLDLEPVRGVLPLRTIRPGTGEVPMLVAMLGTGLQEAAASREAACVSSQTSAS